MTKVCKKENHYYNEVMRILANFAPAKQKNATTNKKHRKTIHN